jgi:serine/threonine-protein kinase RsbW
MTRNPSGQASLRIANRIAELAKVVEFVERFGAEHGVAAHIVNDLNLCLDEILNNTITHGYNDDTAPHTISIALGCDGKSVWADIEDDAQPFDPHNVPEPDLSADIRMRHPGGLGLRFVNALMDEVDYVRSGGYNRIRLGKSLGPKPEGR